MFCKTFAALPLLFVFVAAHNFLITNDDGWATAQARAQFNSFVNAGFNAILSAPANQQTTDGADSTTPVPLTIPCQFNTCPVGSPAIGSDPSNPRLVYVNAFAIDAARFGIQTLAPQFFGGAAPDIVFSGPNIELGLPNNFTIASNLQAAVEAVKEGVPGVSIFAFGNAEVSFTTLTTEPGAQSTIAALTHSDLTTLLGATMFNAGPPFLPPGVVLLVSYPRIPFCPEVSQHQWIFSRLASTTPSVQTCGQANLPLVNDLVSEQLIGACLVTVTAMNATTLGDTDVATQTAVLNKLTGLLSCFNS
ncbi:hypothetical protein EIP91_005247 [Steccherinum ochraceum]|uniref:Survival protein SurE-like phosphatase/nucleotidase domain-containing protein n=1 Tax=Steccherinum ochraceum TaxID=92696 RepID=A0A4V2MXG2_9APHY|nr:hypothetical protein EIP91_005247 [Steccherinum ochraceum]